MFRNYDVIAFISKYLYFKKNNQEQPRVTNFADTIKIATMFIIAAFKGSSKVKRIGN